MRGAFANVRLRNQVAPGTIGGWTRCFDAGGEVQRTHDAALTYRAAGTPLVVVAGRDYGAGSSRDWAAKGPRLLGVRAVLAESFERIHRSNLIGMGVLPLQFLPGDTAESLGLAGEERSASKESLPSSKTRLDATSRSLPGPTSECWCGSTPDARPTTTATAASSRTSCALIRAPRPPRRSRGTWACGRVEDLACGQPPSQPGGELVGGDLGPFGEHLGHLPADMGGEDATLGAVRSGWSAGSGSVLNTSRPAPPSRPSARAATSAGSSMIAPRAVLTRMAPGRMRARRPAFRSPVDAGDSFRWTETTSDRSSRSSRGNRWWTHCCSSG